MGVDFEQKLCYNFYYDKQTWLNFKIDVIVQNLGQYIFCH